jgi:hypothetical protein
VEGICRGGPNDGGPCTPGTSALNAAYPTSHDCPPPESVFIGSLPIPFALSTGTQRKTAANLPAQPRVFCGFCFDPDVTIAFEQPPRACSSDADCTSGAFTQCRQHSPGAFRVNAATEISETGSTAGACMADGAEHDATS